jgi:NACalpha-BTF3-like transcription factor
MLKQAAEVQSMSKMSGQGTSEREVTQRSYDHAAAEARMAKLKENAAKRRAEEKVKEDLIQAVEVNAQDVALISSELCLDSAAAKRRLQERNGDVVAVLREAVGLPKLKSH